MFEDDDDDDIQVLKHRKYPNIVITEKVLDDWLAKQLGLKLNEIPTTRPPCIPVILSYSHALMSI